MSQDEAAECPLCMETLELDDLSFFPCTCGYQICRFCWHRLRTDENGLCPACRKQYTEDPANFKPLSVDEIQQKAKNERKAKKQRLIENRKHLANVRVVQKNLVFVVGLPSRLACSEQLKKQDCFGRFGKIHKVVVNQSTSYAGVQGPSASAYVTYIRGEDALRAIQGVNNLRLEGKTLKASLGTTKYCNHFLKGSQCPKPDCMYLHELGDEAASFTKEQMQAGKHTEYERRLHDQLDANRSTKDGHKDRVSPTTTSDRISATENTLQQSHRTRHKSECSSEEPSSCDDQKSTTPLSERSESPDLEVNPADIDEQDGYDVNFDEISISNVSPSNNHREQADNSRVSPPPHSNQEQYQCFNKTPSSTGHSPSLQSSSQHQQNQPNSLVSDIELDFDPFYISRKGLADLIEREQHNPSHIEAHHQQQPINNLSPSFGGYPYRRISSISRPSPPGMNLSPNQGSSAMFQGLQGPSQVMNQPIGTQQHSPMRRAPPPGFGPPIGSTSQNHGHFGHFSQPPSMSVAPPHTMPPFFNQLSGGDMGRPFGFRAFPQSTTPPGMQRAPSGTHDDLLIMKEQQDQLRQLLPSVNISFGPPPSSPSSSAMGPPGLQGLMGIQRQSAMGLGLSHGGMSNNGWVDTLHDPAILSTSRQIQNATTTGPEQRGPPFF